EDTIEPGDEDIAAAPADQVVTDEGRPAARGVGGDPATAEPGDEATAAEPADEATTDETHPAGHGADGAPVTTEPTDEATTEPGAEAATVYGDNAYGTGEFHDRLDQAGIESKCKTQTPTAPGGRFSKDHFAIDLGAGTVGCPGGVTAPIRPAPDGGGLAGFGPACARCPLRSQCTTATNGRTISIGPYEQTLTDARTRQADPDWVADYRATRPKVERKIGHLMRRKHGGRRARVRGTVKIDADFRLLAAATNLARLATLGLRFTPTGWTATA
ncbi:MAG: transposase, partial [Pseudonocardia sp.]